MVGALELWSSGGLWCAFPRFPGSIHGAAGVTSHSTAGVPGSKKGKKTTQKGQKGSTIVRKGEQGWRPECDFLKVPRVDTGSCQSQHSGGLRSLIKAR